jgi:hypothetical protein
MMDLKKDPSEPTDDKLGRSRQSREAERRQVVEEYVMDLRELLNKLRKLFAAAIAPGPTTPSSASSIASSTRNPPKAMQ